jgi:hypothetical protein
MEYGMVNGNKKKMCDDIIYNKGAMQRIKERKQRSMKFGKLLEFWWCNLFRVWVEKWWQVGCYWFFSYKEIDYVCLYANNYAPKCTCGGIHIGS